MIPLCDLNELNGSDVAQSAEKQVVFEKCFIGQ